MGEWPIREWTAFFNYYLYNQKHTAKDINAEKAVILKHEKAATDFTGSME